MDVKNHHLIDGVTFSSHGCTLSGADSIRLSSMPSSSDVFLHLRAEFPDLTQLTFSSPTTKYDVEHHIATTRPPVHARAQRLDSEKHSIAKAKFENMVSLGIAHRSDSP